MLKSKRLIGNEITNDAGEVAHDQTESKKRKGRTEWTSVILSLSALLISAVSLYQTVLKQANLKLFVPETISYTRDAEGNYEVFILPLTITNSGAQDGVVSSLKLVGTNNQTGKKLIFKASYFVKAEYFMTPNSNGQTGIVQRPKEPYSPIPVAGYSAFGGNILFYPEKPSKKSFMPGEGEYDFVLTLKSSADEQNSFPGSFWKKESKPIKFTAVSGKVASFFPGWIRVGNTWRLSIKDK
jgi:hypothetical protein